MLHIRLLSDSSDISVPVCYISIGLITSVSVCYISIGLITSVSVLHINRTNYFCICVTYQ